MKTELEQQDIEKIALRVVELLQPLMTAKVKCVDDTILDMNALAQYLKVNKVGFTREQNNLRFLL